MPSSASTHQQRSWRPAQPPWGSGRGRWLSERMNLTPSSATEGQEVRAHPWEPGSPPPGHSPLLLLQRAQAPELQERRSPVEPGHAVRLLHAPVAVDSHVLRGRRALRGRAPLHRPHGAAHEEGHVQAFLVGLQGAEPASGEAGKDTGQEQGQRGWEGTGRAGECRGGTEPWPRAGGTPGHTAQAGRSAHRRSCCPGVTACPSDLLGPQPWGLLPVPGMAPTTPAAPRGTPPRTCLLCTRHRHLQCPPAGWRRGETSPLPAGMGQLRWGGRRR